MGVAVAGRRRLIWLAVAVVVFASLAVGVVRAVTAGAAQDEPTATETVEAGKGEVTTEVATIGTLQPAQTRSLSFAVSAEVETIKVRAGNTVTAGQVLATVDDTDAAERVADAEKTLADAYDKLDEAESTAATPTSTGCDVPAAYTSPGTSAGTSAGASTSTSVSPSVRPSASASPSASPSASAGPRASASPATTRTAGTNPSRTSGCTTTGSGSRGVGAGSDAILSAEQRVNAARVALEEAEESLAGTTITAPIAGKVISVAGKVGGSVKSGSTVITLADVYDMQIDADFPEADADDLAVAQKAVVTLADRPGETFDATVVQVDPAGTSDGTLTRFGVVLSFDEAPKELLVGQSATVRVVTGMKENVLRVPSTAVHDVSGDRGTVLKVGTGGGVGTEVEVRLGLRGDQYTEIVSGLTEADRVARSW